MTVSVGDFTTAFPEFVPYNFASPAIQFWLDFALTFVNQAVWGAPAGPGLPFSPCDYGVMLYAAHNIAVALQSQSTVGPVNAATGAATGAPGVTNGIVSSKSVDKVAISYDTRSIVEEAGGNWNATAYGRRFARLAMQFGNAPMYIRFLDGLHGKHRC
jgi:hypothetical protein